MLLILAVATIGLAVYYWAELATSPMRNRRNLVHRAANYGRVRTATGKELPRFRERALAPFVSQVAKLMLRVNPRTTTESVAAKLMAAGMRKSSPTSFIAAKGIFAIVGGFLGLVMGGAASPARAPLFALMLALLGFMGPSLYLNSKVAKRQAAVAAELPDALDLLSVSVEAGLGFDGAVAKLTEHMEGPLVDEFHFTLNEMRIGTSRQDALKRMAERVPAPELVAFVRALVQADQLGISLGRILRVQAADTRNRRQAAAEEKAMKAPIKMLFPTVLFIFPAMFLVILGPAMMHLMELF
jgi:tight adherence protein C